MDGRIKSIYEKEPPTIENKAECYLLYQNGFFGNQPKTWNSYEEIIKSGYKGNVTIRTKERIAGVATTKYNVRPEDIEKEIDYITQQGLRIDKITFNESMPDNVLLIQGELTRTEEGLYFNYSTEKTQMNTALRGENSKIATGLTAKMLLKTNLTPESYEDLEKLLDTFPNDIIEISAWDKNIGNIPGRNAIVWEVRNYTNKNSKWVHY